MNDAGLLTLLTAVALSPLGAAAKTAVHAGRGHSDAVFVGGVRRRPANAR